MPQYQILKPPIYCQGQYLEQTIELPESAATDLLQSGAIAPAIQPENLSALIDLNTATLEELVALPRIGSAIASKLIAARPFDSLEAAQIASGLSHSKWSEVVQFLKVSDVNPEP